MNNYKIFTMKKSALFTFMGSMILAMMLSSCYKSVEDTTLDEIDMTLTYYDTTFNYDQYKTFYVRDSVILQSNYLSKLEIKQFYQDGTSDKLRQIIIDKFKSLGYTHVASDEDFDFAINPLISLMQYTGATYYPGWWWGPGYGDYWGWYGGYDGYWGNYWGYPGWGGGYWYPWGYSYYNYETGTMMMEMIDGNSLREYRHWMDTHTAQQIKDADPADVPALKFEWQCMIEGVLGNGADYNTDRAERGFNEAFEQSPYLHK